MEFFRWRIIVVERNMQKSNSPKKLAIKIVLLMLAVLWIGSIFYPSAPTQPENASEYVRSERELDGLEVALGNLKAGDPLSSSFDFSDWLSPDFKWIVRENKDVLTISSVADREMTFESPLPPDTIWRFGSWSPDSTAFVGMDCLSCMETDIRYVQLILFEVFPEQKKAVSHILRFPYLQRMDSTALLHQSIVWSPDNQNIALVGGGGKTILIFNREGKRVGNINVDPAKPIATSNLLWTKDGIIYIVETWFEVYDTTYEIHMIDPIDGKDILVWNPNEGSKLPKILGSHDQIILIARNLGETDIELIAINLETQSIEKSWPISAREVSQTDRFNPGDPYLVFNTVSVDFTPQVWFLDWDSLETKYMFSDVNFDTMGWSSALDGIGVFRKGGKGIELWVINP